MTPSADPHLSRARAIAKLLDSAVGVPGTKFRFGLDPVLGLIPGLGDFAGALLSGYVILTAVRLGAPRTAVVRMVGNVAIDTILGSVPVLGDLFDASWKANQKNLALIEQHVGVPGGPPPRGNRLLMVGALLAVVLIVGAGIALTWFLIRAIAHQF